MVWFLAVPPDMTLRRKLKDVGVEDQKAMRAALVGAAHADGVIQTAQTNPLALQHSFHQGRAYPLRQDKYAYTQTRSVARLRGRY